MTGGPRSARIRSFARLAKRRHRLESGLFLIEGPHGVLEALRYRPNDVVEVFATAEACERHGDVAQEISHSGARFENVDDDVIRVLADTVTPQGFVAVARQFPVRMSDVFTARPGLIAILDNIRDPGNAGTIIRVADAAGADAVVFAGDTVDPFSPKVVRSTVGSLFHVTIGQSSDLAAACAEARAAGVMVVATAMDGDSILDARRAGVFSRPTAWVFGNEAQGLSSKSQSYADRVISIPMYGKAESLNLSTAASVCLFESAFQQNAPRGNENAVSLS